MGIWGHNIYLFLFFSFLHFFWWKYPSNKTFEMWQGLLISLWSSWYRAEEHLTKLVKCIVFWQYCQEMSVMSLNSQWLNYIQKRLLTINKILKIMSGTPITAPTTVSVRSIPTTIKTKPSTIPINLPVKFRMKARKSHRAANGQKIQGTLCRLALAIFN